MGVMEQIVRPFQTPDNIRDKALVVTSVTKVPVQKAVIVWGAVGKQPTPYSTGLAFKVIDKLEYNEASRKTTDVTITDANNPENQLTAQRIDEISFKKKKDDPSTSTGNVSGLSGGTSAATATAGDASDFSLSDVTKEKSATSTISGASQQTFRLSTASS